MFFLSWRQLMARKRQTLLILLGISFGTMMFVGISGIQLGMRQYISEQLLNNTAHVLISGAENEILPKDVTEALYGNEPVFWQVAPAGKRDEVRLANYQGWYERLNNDTHVFDFSARLSTNAIITNGKFTQAVSLTGVVPEKYMRISSIEKYITQGSFNDLKGGGNRIIIGSEVAKKIGVHVNQFVHVNTGRFVSQPFKVVGIVHYGNQQIDETMALAHLNNVQTINHTPGRLTSISVALTDIEESTERAHFWSKMSTDQVQDWKEANRMFMEVFRVQDITRYFITFAILIVASFGIYNVLTIMINQKRKEIAILRAIGYGPQKILELILYQGLLLGIGGGVAGLILGYVLCRWVESIDFGFGFEIGGSNHLLMSYDWDIYVIALVTANITSLIASYFPAWEASRMTPMDIIRSES